VTCPNRHTNPEHYRHCGECGALLAAAASLEPPKPYSASGKPGVEAQKHGVLQASNYGQPQQFYRPLPPPVQRGSIYRPPPPAVQRVPNYLPPPAQRGPSYAKLIAFVAVALLGAITVVMVAAGLHKSTTTASGGSTHTTSTIIPGSSDDWYAAVCQPGTFHDGGGNGQWLTNSVGRASCGSSVNIAIWIFIGQYSSEYMPRNDAALFGRAGGSSAMLRDTDGYMLFVAPTDRTGAALQPLAKYGFTIS